MRSVVLVVAAVLLSSPGAVASSPQQLRLGDAPQGGLLLDAHAARSTTKKKAASWVALVHTVGDVPAHWAAALRTAAESVTDQRTWLPPPDLSIDEIQLTLGCATWGPTCAGQATALIGADNALVIDVTRDTHGIVVRIDGVSGTGTVVGDGERVEVPADDDGLQVAEAWVIGSIKGARPTVLIVTSDLEGTEVLIDGRKAGVTPLTLVNALTVGEHRLMLRRENRAPLTRPIVVQPGTVNREHAVLANGPAMKSIPTVGETPPAPLVGPDGTAPSAMVVAGFALGGVGAAATIGGLVSAAITFGRERDVVDTVGGEAVVRKDLCVFGDGSYGPSSSSSCTVILVDGQAGPDQQSRAEHQGRILDYVNGLRQNGNVALVIAGAGLVVAVTGIAIGVAALPGESADATVVAAP